jgi:glycerate dehydrogenase
MHGVFLDEGSINCGDIDLSDLKKALPEWRVYEYTAPTEVADRLRDAVVVVTNKVVIDESALAAAPTVRLICVAATGTNNIDIEAARRHHVVVCNVRGYATAAVTQHVFMLTLNLLAHLPEYRQAVRAGAWNKSRHFCLLDFPIAELAGKVLGIVGYGDIGRSVAAIGRAFDMRVVIAARRGTTIPEGRNAFDDVVALADVLSLHCPLSEETRGIINARVLARMKSTAILINTARGGLIDEYALAQALRTDRLGGAGIDVLDSEPPASDNPLLMPDVPNIIVTPHIAWASREARQRLIGEVRENILAYLDGQVRNGVG